MKAETASHFARPVVAASNEEDIAYYTRRIGEERDLAITADSDVARSAHRTLGLIYRNHLRDLRRLTE